MTKMSGGERPSRRGLLKAAGAATVAGLMGGGAKAGAPSMGKDAFPPVTEGFGDGGGEDLSSEDFGGDSHSEGGYDGFDLEEYVPTEVEKQKGIAIAPLARQALAVLNAFGELAALSEKDGGFQVSKGVSIVRQVEEKDSSGSGLTGLRLETEEASGGVLREKREGEMVEARCSADGTYVYVSYVTPDGSGEWFTVQPTLNARKALVRRGTLSMAKPPQKIEE